MPHTDTNRRLTLLILTVIAGYTAVTAAVLRVAFGFIGHGLLVSPSRTTELYIAMWYHGLVAAVVGLLALHVRRRPIRGRYPPRLALLAAVVVATVSLDRFASVAYPPPSSKGAYLAPHPTRGWCLRPGLLETGAARPVRINRHGLRGPEYPRAKPPGEFRILCLGDSIAFGFLLGWEDTFVVRAEQRLRQHSSGPTIRLINAGFGGYTTWQEFDFLKNEGIRLEPDLVVLTYCMNDMVELINFEPGKIYGSPIRFDFPNASHWSGLVRAAKSIIGHRRDRAVRDRLMWTNRRPFDLRDPTLQNMDDLYREPPPERVRAAWVLALEHLDQLRAFCRARGLPLVLQYCPFWQQLGPKAKYRQAQRRLTEWARLRDVYYLDLMPAFDRELERTGGDVRDLMMDGVHPTAAGSVLISEAMTDMLESKRLVPTLRDGPSEDSR